VARPLGQHKERCHDTDSSRPAPGTTTLGPPTRPQLTGPSWARIFVGGLVLWSAAVLVPSVTRDANLVPTIVLLGSFLVPVAFVSHAYGHADGGRRTVRVTLGQHPA
jgi:hypothetical protein